MYTEFLILATLFTLCSLSRNSHSVLFFSTSRHLLSDFSIRTFWLLDMHSLTSRYSLPFFCTKFITHTQIHANASILLVLDVSPEGLAINSLKAQAYLSLLFMYTSAVEYQGKSWALSQNCLSHKHTHTHTQDKALYTQTASLRHWILLNIISIFSCVEYSIINYYQIPID